MLSLKQSQIKRILDAILKLHGTHDPTTLVDEMIEVTSALIPCPAVAYNEINLKAKTAKVVHNFSSEADRLLPYMAQYIHENPILANHSKHPDAVTKFSDFVSRAQFQKTNFYNAFMRPLGLESQLAVWVRWIPDVAVTLSLQLDKKDFTETDRAILELLTPHFRLAFINAAQFQLARSQSQRILSSLEQARTGLMFLTPAGKLVEITPYAAQCLQWFFGHSLPRTLPEPLVRWLKLRRTGGDENLLTSAFCPYVVQNEHGRLTVRVSASPEGQALMLTHCSPPTPTIGQKLGLTKREAEVLFWLSEGKTDDAIARILSMSVRTANKHVENIRRKLNVETRGAAARLMQEMG